MPLGISTTEGLWILAGLLFLALRNRPLTNLEWEDFYFFAMRTLCVSTLTAALATRIFGALYSPLIFFSTVVLSGINFLNVANRIAPFAIRLCRIQEEEKVNVFVKLLLLYLSKKRSPERSLVLLTVVLSAIVASLLVLTAAEAFVLLMLR